MAETCECDEAALSTLVIQDLEESNIENDSILVSPQASKGSLMSCMTVESPYHRSGARKWTVNFFKDSAVNQSRTIYSSTNECYINILPAEILLYIFSFFSVPELCQCLAPVCTAWRDLSRDPTLWKRLEFLFQHPVEGEQICQLLARSPHLLTLELQSREDGGDLLLQVAATCTKLQELTVKFCDGLTDSVFKALMDKCPNIRYLNVEGSRVCSKDCCLHIAGLKQLRHLNLSHCPFLDDDGLVTIAMQCQHLQYLDIDGITNIHDYSVKYLTKKLGHCLDHLFLDGESLTDSSYQSLKYCTSLKKLGISFCEEMTDIGLSGIYDLKHLVWLKLRKGNRLTPKGLELLFSKGGLPLLTYVNLGECSLMDDTVLLALASVCPRLVHLVLHWCWDVTDTGISAVVAACPKLRVLDLVGVVQLTGEAFTDIPTTLPDLVILDLEQCNNVDDAILGTIVTKKPSLRVFDYWGDPVMPAENVDATKDSGTMQSVESGS